MRRTALLLIGMLLLLPGCRGGEAKGPPPGAEDQELELNIEQGDVFTPTAGGSGQTQPESATPTAS